MVRTLLCASLALLLCAGIGLSAEKGKGKGKKGNQVHGKVLKVDTAANTLTLTVKKQKETSEKQVTVSDETRFVTFNGEERSEKVGKNGLKEVRTGDRVRVKLNASGAAVEVAINPPRKAKKPK